MDGRDLDNRINRMQDMGKLPVELTVQVCTQSMTLDQFLQWVPGTILEFERSSSSPLVVSVGNRKLGTGKAVKVGAKFGLRLDSLDASRE